MRLTITVLAGLGLFDSVLGAPADMGNVHSAISPATTWKDTQFQKYHCEGMDVFYCETTAGDTCFAINICEESCVNHDDGVFCVDLGTPFVATSSEVEATSDKTLIPSPNLRVTARDASPQENMHYTCSRNRASVLICKYGFCSTDHYCGTGSECKDECNCCRSPLAQSVRSEVRAVSIQREDTASRLAARRRSPKKTVSRVCSKDRASILKCEYGFCSTDYYCSKGHPCVDNPARCKKDRDIEG